MSVLGRLVRGSPEGLLLALPMAVGLVLAALVARGHGPVAVLVLLMLLMTIVGVRDWRISVYGLLVYLPFSGIPALIAFPHNGPELLLKDLLFVGPACLGFLVEFVSREKRITFAGAPVTLFGIFAVLVFLQMFNPNDPNLLVGLIGAKVWLLYIPLLFLGYHLITERRQLDRMLGLMCFAAILPAALTVVESILFATGQENLLKHIYGPSLDPATQHFAVAGLAGAQLRRVPGTFTFVAQNYLFTSAMVAVSFAWWQYGRRGTVRRGARLCVWVLMLLAAFLTGTRAAFVFTPLLVVVMVALEGRQIRLLRGRLVPVALSFLLAVSLFGGHPGKVLTSGFSLGFFYFKSVFIDGIGYAIHHSVLGLGTGISTTGSAHAVAKSLLFQNSAGVGESWYVKAAIELGLAGALILLSVLAVFVVRLFRLHARLRSPSVRAVSAAVVGLLLFNVLNAAKGPFIDLDPMNVYLWLLLGVAFKLPQLDQAEIRQDEPTHAADAAVVEARDPPEAVQEYAK